MGTFVGRDSDKSVPDSIRDFRRVWPRLVAHAEDRGVTIAVENCPMIFSLDEWPGGHNLAYAPAIWDELFDIVPSPRFGLNLDPLTSSGCRSTTSERCATTPTGSSTCTPRTSRSTRTGSTATGPRRSAWAGRSRASRGSARCAGTFLAFYRAGYDYVVSIEHEDRSFERTEELVKRGFLLARDVLRPYLR